jgi:protein-L-isoaspartate(D-aspartate) O-methyltransferase
MVSDQLATRDIVDPRVLAAMARVPRHEFVPTSHQREAYEDRPVPIGWGQTISQPYIVAWMTQALGLEPGMRVLEIGTGCGYQTALLVELDAEVYSLEIIPQLAEEARMRLARLGYGAVHLRIGTGYDGWSDAAPFDRILLTAAPPDMPQTLIDQLKDGGRIVGPVGTVSQVIEIVERHGEAITRRHTVDVRFVPMV